MILVLAQSGGSSNFFIALMLGLGAWLLLSSLFNRKNQKQFQDMLTNLKKNDRVMTIGGIVGSVVSCTPEEVVLKVDESANVKITFVRSAIKKVLTEAPKSADLK